MKVLIILCCLVAVQAGVVNKVCRSSVSIEGAYYYKELLLKHFDRPYLLKVKKKTNDLYFSYSLDENNTNSLSVQLNLNRKKYYTFKSIDTGYSHAVDQETGDVYIGAYEKIYKYKPIDTPTEIINNVGNWISDMFFKDDILYYVTYPEAKLYAFKKGRVNHLPEFDGLAIDHFVIIDRYIMLFANGTGTYVKIGDNILLVKNDSKEEVQGLAIDNNGKLYACLTDGVYVIDDETMSMRKILDVPSAFGVAFDRDNNMIYSTDSGIVRLLPMEKLNCEFIFK